MEPQNKKPQQQMPRFNMNWIYGIVILSLIVLYFTQGQEKSSISTQVSYSDFKVMVDKGYAKEIVVNKYQNTLEMYVKPEHIRDVFHQGVEQTGKNPAVSVAIGSVDQVEQFINNAREEKKFTGKFSYDNSKDNDFPLLWRYHPGMDVHHASHGWRFPNGWFWHLQRRQVESPDV